MLFRGLKPDVTPAQVIGLAITAVPGVAKFLAAFHVYTLSVAQQASLTELLKWAAIAAGTLFASDAVNRFGRNQAAGKRDAAVLLANQGEHTQAVKALTAALDRFHAPVQTPSVASGNWTSVPTAGGQAATDEPSGLTPVAKVATPVEDEGQASPAAAAVAEPASIDLVSDSEEFDAPPPPLPRPDVTNDR